MVGRRCLLALGAVSLAARAAAAPTPPLHWDFSARAVPGVVHVMPVVTAAAPLSDTGITWVGAGLDPRRAETRAARDRMVSALPRAIADALPGAINGQVGPDWGGSFTVGRYPLGGKRRVAHAIGDIALPPTLSALASSVSADAALFVWVESVQASPLSAETFAGDIVQTGAGPVVVDHAVEPYRVLATVGAALVARDGEVIVRYVDAFETTLTDSGPHPAGRSIATQLAEELALVWPSDPRLQERYALAE